MSFPETRPTLLSRMRRREEGAWDEFVRAYTGPALGFLCWMGLSEHDAQDVWQEQLLKLSSVNHDAYPPERGSFRAWLMKALRRRQIDLHRWSQAAMRDVAKTVRGDAPLSPDDPDGATLFAQLRDQAQRHYAESRKCVEEELEPLLLDCLNEGERRAYRDWFWNEDGLTNEAIAARHGLDRDQLTYIRRKVTARLKE
jgi:RNA polymerase sigma factor (sigma-70 family)